MSPKSAGNGWTRGEGTSEISRGLCVLSPSLASVHAYWLVFSLDLNSLVLPPPILDVFHQCTMRHLRLHHRLRYGAQPSSPTTTFNLHLIAASPSPALLLDYSTFASFVIHHILDGRRSGPLGKSTPGNPPASVTISARCCKARTTLRNNGGPG